MSQETQDLQFLCQVVQELPNDNYKVTVNSDDLLSLPEDKKSTDKVIVCKAKLPVGSLLLCKAKLYLANRQVNVENFLYVSNKIESSILEVELEPELITMVESLDSTPKDLMDLIYAEELEDDEELPDESRLQDSENKEGDI